MHPMERPSFLLEHAHYALSICDLPAKPVNSKRAQVVNLLAVLATTVSQEGLEIVEHVHPLPQPWVFPRDIAFMREVQFVVQTRDHSLSAQLCTGEQHVWLGVTCTFPDRSSQ